MNSNFEINKEKVLNDYYKCIGAFKNCRLLYKNRLKTLYSKTKTEEEKLIQKGREDDLLSNLGKVGEKALKYIFGLEILKTYPNIEPGLFEIFFKREKSLKDFAEKHGINRDDERIINLINYNDANNQKAHNFDYWFSVIDVIMTSISEKYKKFIEYKLQSKILIKYADNEGYSYNDGEYSLPFLAAIFPDINTQNLECIPTLDKKQLNRILTTKREVIRKSGDIFTRFRYAANNPDKKVFSVDEIYDIITDLINFIELIHYNKENLDFNLEDTYAKIMMIRHIDKLGISQEEIQNLFNLNIDIEIALIEGYNYNKIKRLLDMGISKEELTYAMCYRLTAKNITYFNSLGITDFGEMRALLNKYVEEGTPINRKKL